MSFRRAWRHGGVRHWLPLLLALAPVAAWAELPVGWTVHTFTGRIHEIEPAGGVLACATDGGLLFFDPQSQQFAPPIADAGCVDEDCLSSNRLTSVSRDAEGSYWLGTEASGVVVYRPASTGRQFDRFFEVNATPGGGLLADSVRCVEAYRARAVYVGTSRGVAQIELVAGSAGYEPDASRRLGSDLKGTVVHDLAVDSLFVWVATDSGVSRYERTSPYAVEFLPDSLAGREALTVEILAGTVYAGSPVGVFRWREADRYWERVRNCPTCPPQSPPTFRARTIARLSDGRLFVGSDAAVYTYNGFVWGPLSPPGIYLLGNRVFTSIVATGDTVWTCQHNGEGEGGYLETWSVAQPTWRRFEPNAIPPSAIQAMSLAAGGDLWIGTRFAGVARLETDGTWCIWNGNDPDVRANMSDDEGHVSALLAAGDGKVWFTALPQPNLSAVVDLLAPSATCDHAADDWTHLQPGQQNLGGRYWRFVQDAGGNAFMLADGDVDAVPGEDGGIDVISADLTQVANLRADVLGGGSIGALAFETTNIPWSFAYVGINNLSNTGLKQWSRSGQLFPPDLPTESNFFELRLPSSRDVVAYRDIVVTPGNVRRLWVGTQSDLFEYDVNIQSIADSIGPRRDARPGLLSGDIKDLQFDDFGNLWVATVKGLNRVRLSERRPDEPLAIDAFTTIETIRELNAAAGSVGLYDPAKALAPLPSPLVTALSYDHDRDLLYIGTSGGLAILDVQRFSQRPVIPLAQAILYPNPVRIDAGHEEVRIANISEPATVTIFTIEGEIVCEVSEREDGDVVWTLSTPSCLPGEGNFQIASGIYPVRITTSSGSTMRTLVVVR